MKKAHKKDLEAIRDRMTARERTHRTYSQSARAGGNGLRSRRAPTLLQDAVRLLKILDATIKAK